jgi:hypothetical protein
LGLVAERLCDAGARSKAGGGTSALVCMATSGIGDA